MSREFLYKTVLLKNFIINNDGKLKDEALESTSSDCGYFSGSIILSGDIKPEEEEEETSTQPEEAKVAAAAAQEAEIMRLDSGVVSGFDLTNSFSELDIHSGDLNDLTSKKKIVEIATPSVVTPVLSKQADEDYFQQDEDGNTCLHFAIAQGRLDTVLTLIRTAPHPFHLDTPNDNAQTPIHIAVATGQYQIVRWLIVAGAKPAPRNIEGDSPLHLAVRNNDLNCCKAITHPVHAEERQAIKLSYADMPHYHCDLEQWNYEGHTCVHVAALEGHVESLRHLVLQGADINARDGCQGYTALHYSIQRRDSKMMHFLMNECNGLNTNAVTYGGKGALQLGYLVPTDIAEMLRSRGAESPYTSEDESESESESMYEMSSNNLYQNRNLVNASA